MIRHVFYPVLVDRDGAQFVIELPDFAARFRIPASSDPADAAREKVADLVERRRDAGGAGLPPATPLVDLTGRLPVPVMLFQVPVGTYRDYVRVGVSLEPKVLHRIDKAATSAGMSRSSFLTAAAIAFLSAELLDHANVA